MSDWVCAECENENDAANTACDACDEPRPVTTSGGRRQRVTCWIPCRTRLNVRARCVPKRLYDGVPDKSAKQLRRQRLRRLPVHQRVLTVH